MILKELRIKNFISHKNTHIKFGPGITLIVGPNGAGKSSILDAISFALFRETDRGNLDDLINRRSSHMEVTLRFLVDDAEYMITRRKTKGKPVENAFYKIENGTPRILARQHEDVLKAIEKIVGLNKELFLSGVYIKQGEIAALLEKGKTAERKKLMARLLGIDTFEKAYSNMRDVVKHFEKILEYTRGQIKRIPDVEQKINIQKERLEKERAEFEKIKMELEAKKKKQSEYKKLKEEWDRKEDTFSRLQTEIKNAKAFLDKIREDIKGLLDDLEEVKQAEIKIKEYEPIIKNKKSLERAKEISATITNLELEVNSIAEKLTEIEELEKALVQNEDGYNEYIKLEREIERLNKKAQKLSVAKGELEAYRKQYDALISEIETQKRELNKIYKVITNLGFTIELTAKKTIKPIKDKISKLEKGIDKGHKALQNIKARIGEYEGMINEIQKIVNTLETAEDKCPVCNSKLTPEHKQKVIVEQKRKMEKLNVEKKKLEDKAKVTEKELKALEEEYETLSSAVNPEVVVNLFESIKKSEEELESIKKKIDGGEKSLNDLKLLEKEIEQKQSAHDKLKESYNAYLAAKSSLKGKNKISLETKKKNLEKKLKEKKDLFSEYIKKAGVAAKDVHAELEKLEEMEKEYIRFKTIAGKKGEIEKDLNQKKTDEKETKEKIDAWEKQIEDLEFDEEKYEEIKKTLEALNKEVSELESTLEGKRATQNEISRNIKELTEELSELKAKEAEYANLEKFTKFLETIRRHFSKDGIQKILREKSRPLIEYHTQQIFQEFNMPFSEVKLTEDYNIILLSDSAEFDMDMISGGEKIAIALALRLGIAKALAGEKLELIMLDEPTVHLDTQRREELVDILIQMRAIPQVIIVTHDEELKQAADSILSVSIKNNISEVKFLEELH